MGLKAGGPFAETIRYQLLHRTASAILEARRFGAPHAVMIVQAFRPGSESLADYEAFGRHLGVGLSTGTLTPVPRHTDPVLFLGWAVSPLCTDAEIARTAV